MMTLKDTCKALRAATDDALRATAPPIGSMLTATTPTHTASGRWKHHMES
jgi:hypothetical protein